MGIQKCEVILYIKYIINFKFLVIKLCLVYSYEIFIDLLLFLNKFLQECWYFGINDGNFIIK